MKTQKIVIGALIGVAIAYLLCAFVELDLNPSKWLKSTRTGCVGVMTFGACVGALLAWAKQWNQ